MKLTNIHNISVPMAVWLLNDEYDYVNLPNYISATSLLNGTKKFVLGKRIDKSTLEMDISSLAAARTGHAIHDSIEKTWRDKDKIKASFRKLNIPENVADRFVINPEEGEKLSDDAIPIYFEKRTKKEFQGWVVGGQFDMVAEGRLIDFKTTSVFSYTSGKKDEDYRLQGSIYRWLNPELISEDHLFINFLFKDWKKGEALRNPAYPQSQILEYPIKLLSLEETEEYIKNKLRQIERFISAPEEQIPDCTPEELWMDPPIFSYYSNPLNTARATKNFNSKAEADKHLSERGKGIVLERVGKARACEYCVAFTICKQKDRYDFSS